MVGDCRTAALVSRDGSVDWLCLPRFDSGACFAALLGGSEHGRWQLAPLNGAKRIERKYRPGTLLLDTVHHDEGGSAVVTDFMPIQGETPRLVRVVRGQRGCVRMRTELVVRFDYGSIVPWMRRVQDGLVAVAGADSLHIQCDVPLHGEGLTTVGEFDVAAGQTVALSIAWQPSHLPAPRPADATELAAETERRWGSWSARLAYTGEWRENVHRSLVTLAALTHADTGAILAAPTTSLPEALGGVRNWDYRYCWLRDATFTLLALIHNGFFQEARAWREWLLRAVAGDPSKLQILYGLDGERRIAEEEVEWLPGYEGSRPVRLGNAASTQRQLDVYGEVLDSMYQCRRVGLEPPAYAADLERALLESLETRWEEPDEGIWEVRGPRRRFTHSRVMAWLAFDRGVRMIEEFGSSGPLERWRHIRTRIHDEVCRQGFDPELGAFVQYYGSRNLDASLLMIPLVGFLPPSDPRVIGTALAIERRLMRDGLVIRYDSDGEVDGLPRGEGAFLPCSFWLVDNWALMDRHEDARRLFERLVGLSNDVGLLSEEYDCATHRLVGNFPQALSHVSLVNSAHNLCRQTGPARSRSARGAQRG